MAEDSDLPVFSFRNNWREPMTERLAFLTDVLRAAEGAEQRRSLRPTPRRTFEVDLLLTGPERTFWDLFTNRLSKGEIVAPLYWEVTTLSTATVAGTTDRIAFDTTYREWAYHEGRLAILMGKTAMDYEVVEIAGVDDTGVDLAEPTARAWPRGTKLLPLRRCVIEQIGQVRQPSAAVATVTLQMRVVGPNPWTPAADTSPTYLGRPVLLQEPNWAGDLTVDVAREIALLDVDVGLTYQVDALGRTLYGQAHNWFLNGRRKLAAFRDFVYRHRGRAGSFWLPTFKADFVLTNSPGSAATQIEVQNTGFGYVGGPTGGREYIAIKHSTGTIIRRITSVIAGTTSATERLNLDAPLGLALSPGLVRRISFVDTARLDTDEFQITHYGGVDGHHESSTTFRTFKASRSAPLPISYPIPAAAQTNDPCGEAPGDCYFDQPPVFDGWYLKFRVDFINLVAVDRPNLGFILTGDGWSRSNVDTNPLSAIGYWTVVPNQYIECTVTTPLGFDPQTLDLQMQFSGGTLGPTTRAATSYRRWTDEEYIPISPNPGSFSTGNPFVMGMLFPFNWYFTI